MSKPRIVYLVSRFPRTSETFIVRELDSLAQRGEYDIELRSLFPSPDTVVHDIARKWTERLVRPRGVAVLGGILWALRRHPVALASVVWRVVREHARQPGMLARALLTTVLACAHAKDLEKSSGIVHVHAHYATYPALAAWVCYRLVGTGYSFTAHAHDLYVDQSMLPVKVADARFVVTISEFNRALLSKVNELGTPVEVIHCGIDIAQYPYQVRNIPTRGPVRALCIASLQEYKGHRFLLEALAGGGPNVDRIQLDLVGDGVLRDELHGMASDLGIADRVRFLGSRDEVYVREALAEADLFVLPSVIATDGQMEGLPVVLMEALACGVPTVSTALSGIPEIIIDGVTGRLVQPEDVNGLRKALDAVIADRTGAVRHSKAGRKLVEHEFVLADQVTVFARLLGRHVPSA